MQEKDLIGLAITSLAKKHDEVRAGRPTRRFIKPLVIEQIENYEDAIAAMSLFAKCKNTVGYRSATFLGIMERVCWFAQNPSQISAANSLLIAEKLTNLQKVLVDRALSICDPDELRTLLALLPDECELSTAIKSALAGTA